MIENHGSIFWSFGSVFNYISTSENIRYYSTVVYLNFIQMDPIFWIRSDKSNIIIENDALTPEYIFFTINILQYILKTERLKKSTLIPEMKTSLNCDYLEVMYCTSVAGLLRE